MSHVFWSVGNSSHRARATLVPSVWCCEFGSGNVSKKKSLSPTLTCETRHLTHLVEKRVQEGEETVSEVEGVTRGGGNGVAEHGRVLSKIFKKCCHCYRYWNNSLKRKCSWLWWAFAGNVFCPKWQNCRKKQERSFAIEERSFSENPNPV